MQSLDRRVSALEGGRSECRRAAEMSDAELLAIAGWTGAVPPTDDELRAFTEKGDRHGTAD